MWKYYLMGILVLAIGGAGVALRAQIKKNGVVQTQLDSANASLSQLAAQAKANAALSKRRAESEARARAQADRARRDLEAALRANREWADMPIPKEVQDALPP